MFLFVRSVSCHARLAPRWILAILLPGVGASLAATPGLAAESPLTVENAVERVLADHPALAAARESVRATDAAREQAGAWANPELELEAEGLGGNRSWSDPEERTLALSLPLEVFGTRGARAWRGEAELARARSERDATERGLVAETWSAFHRALAAQLHVDLARARATVTRRTARAFAAEVETGKTSPLQSLRGDVEHERARAELAAALADRRTAHGRLAALWNATVADSLALHGELRAEPLQLDAAALERELVASHPALESTRWAVEAQRRGERVASRERWPRLVSRAGVRAYADSDQEDFVASLSLDLPVFDRGAAALAEAERRTRVADHEAEDLRRQLCTELRVLLDELATRGRAIEAYEREIVPRAERMLERIHLGHEHGKFSGLELLDAQRTWIDVQESRARARIAYDATLVQIESLLGRRLTPADLPPSSPALEEQRP